MYNELLDQDVKVLNGLEILLAEASSKGDSFEETKVHELVHVEIYVRYNNMLANEINWLERSFCNPCYRLATNYGNAAVKLRRIQVKIEHAMFDVQDYTATGRSQRAIRQEQARLDGLLAKLGEAINQYNKAGREFYENSKCVENGSKFVPEEENAVKADFKKASWYDPN